MSKSSIMGKVIGFKDKYGKEIGSVLFNLTKILNKSFKKKSKGNEKSRNNQKNATNKQSKNSQRNHTSSDDQNKNYDNNSSKVSNDQSYYNEDSFENNITNRIFTNSLTSIKNPAQAINIVNNFLEIAGQVQCFREAQITKRFWIESERQKSLALIGFQKELILAYLENTFDERKMVFQKYFSVVDNAIETGNPKTLSMGLNSINKLARSSPFKELSNIDSVGNALKDKDHTWDF